MRVILLGPQRRPTLGAVIRALSPSLPPDRRIATVTAGWQEREADDREMSRVLGGRDANLALYRRWLDVQDSDPEYAAAERRLADVLAELQDLYLLRLDHALGAVYALQRRDGRGPAQRLRGDAVAEAIAAVRELDAAHLQHVNDARGEFFEVMRPHDRPAIAGHRAAVADALAESGALVIAGGHVGVLAEALHLFNVAAALHTTAGNGQPPVIAWSAGAMALAERIVLFHDRSPHGPGHPELYGSGLSVIRGLVPLPHARTRLLLEDRPRMEVFARRLAPARCVLLDAGTQLDCVGDGGPDSLIACPPGTRVLGEDGQVTALEAA